MGRFAYFGILLGIACGFAGIASWALRSGGVRLLWRTAAAAVTLLSFLGVLDATLAGVAETPIHTYILLATLPTLATTLVIQWLATKRASVAVQVLGGGTAWLCIGGLALFSGFFP